jgi:hypothetical protein
MGVLVVAPTTETAADDPLPAIGRFPRNLWAMLPARIDEVFPLTGPPCGASGPMAVRTKRCVAQPP